MIKTSSVKKIEAEAASLLDYIGFSYEKIENKTSHVNKIEEEKKSLVEAWNSAVKKNEDLKDILIAESFPNQTINMLKARGYLTGFGRNVSFTQSGKAVLIETILSQGSSLKKVASTDVSKMKIVRSKDGKWIAQEEEKKELEDQLQEVVKAEKDFFLFKKANSNEWQKKYDINKLSELKNSIMKEIKKYE
jgi:hypothetical protein